MSKTPRRSKRGSKTATTPSSAASVVGSVNSTSSTGSYKPSVSWPTQKVLAEELESAFPISKGINPVVALSKTGPQAFSKFFDGLVARDTEEDTYYRDLFGKRGDPIRANLSDLLGYWKEKSVDNYGYRVLRKFGVTPPEPEAVASPQQTPRNTRHSARNAQTPTIAEDECLTDSDQEAPVKAPKAASIRKSNVPKNIQFEDSKPAPTNVQSKQIRTKMDASLRYAPASVAREAGVDLIDLENISRTPHPFKVYAAQNLAGKREQGKPNRSWGGYIVVMRVHPIDLFGIAEKGRTRGFDRFKYKMKRLNETTLVVETPVMDFSDSGYDDDAIRDLLTNRADGEVVMNAIDNSYNKYKEQHYDAGKMQWHLIFPSSVHLDETVLETHAGQTGGELKSEPLMVSRTVDRLKNSNYFEEDVETEERGKMGSITKQITVNVREHFYHATPRLFWRIADKKRDVETKGRAAVNQGQTDDDFAAQFMNVSVGPKKPPPIDSYKHYPPLSRVDPLPDSTTSGQVIPNSTTSGQVIPYAQLPSHDQNEDDMSLDGLIEEFQKDAKEGEATLGGLGSNSVVSSVAGKGTKRTKSEAEEPPTEEGLLQLVSMDDPAHCLPELPPLVRTKALSYPLNEQGNAIDHYLEHQCGRLTNALKQQTVLSKPTRIERLQTLKDMLHITGEALEDLSE